MVSVKGIIETIDWEMGKRDIQNAFSYMSALPPQPTQNAIGFETEIAGIPSAVICYFQKRLFKEKLGAVNIMIYEDPPPPYKLKETQSKIYEEICASYGKPRRTQAPITIWVFRGRVLQMSTDTGILGIRYGDPKLDPPSAISIGREEM